MSSVPDILDILYKYEGHIVEAAAGFKAVQYQKVNDDGLAENVIAEKFALLAATLCSRINII
jgi:hypothetical protein